jgi:hypothetical protein
MPDNTAPQTSAQAEKIADMLRAFTRLVRAVRETELQAPPDTQPSSVWSWDMPGLMAVSSEQLAAELEELGISGYNPEQVTEPPD